MATGYEGFIRGAQNLAQALFPSPEQQQQARLRAARTGLLRQEGQLNRLQREAQVAQARAFANRNLSGALTQSFMTSAPDSVGAVADAWLTRVANNPESTPDQIIRALAGTGETIGVNEAVTAEDRESVRAANAANDFHKQAMRNSAAMARQRARIANDWRQFQASNPMVQIGDLNVPFSSLPTSVQESFVANKGSLEGYYIDAGGLKNPSFSDIKNFAGIVKAVAGKALADGQTLDNMTTGQIASRAAQIYENNLGMLPVEAVMEAWPDNLAMVPSPSLIQSVGNFLTPGQPFSPTDTVPLSSAEGASGTVVLPGGIVVPTANDVTPQESTTATPVQAQPMEVNGNDVAVLEMPDGTIVTEADIQYNMEKYGKTRAEVMQRALEVGAKRVTH